MTLKRFGLLAGVGLLTMSLVGGGFAQQATTTPDANAMAPAGNAMAPAANAMTPATEPTSPVADAFVPPATPEEAVAARKALMRTQGGTLRAAGTLTGPEAVQAMETLRDTFSRIPLVFPEGSIVGDSKALPVIWENWEAFIAIAKTGEDAAIAGIAAAQAGDMAGYMAAVQTIGGTCGTCHGQFRAP